MEIGMSQDLMPTRYSHWKATGSCPHLLLLWLFSSACPWVDNCVSLCECKQSLCFIKEVSRILCCVTYWVCHGKVVPCKTDKGTAICSLRHHDKYGDSESADICRYYHWSHGLQNAVPVPHRTTQLCSLSNKHHTSLSKLPLGPLVALVLAALSALALAAWNLLLHFLPKISFPVLCPSWL